MGGYGEGEYGNGIYGVGEDYDNFVESNIWEKIPSIHRDGEESILKKYVTSHQDELNSFESNFDDVMASHQIDRAKGDELDRIGAMYGELGMRAERDDATYRQYLKSITSSLSGRGTVPGIKFTISGGIGTTEEHVSLPEHFDELENTVQLDDWNAHSSDFVHVLYNLSKPSVVQLREPIQYHLYGASSASSGYSEPGNKARGLGSGFIGDNNIDFYDGLGEREHRVFRPEEGT